MNPKKTLQSAFETAIREFIAYRRKHGGILLPDVFIVEDAFRNALCETGLREAPPEPMTEDEWQEWIKDHPPDPRAATPEGRREMLMENLGQRNEVLQRLLRRR